VFNRRRIYKEFLRFLEQRYIIVSKTRLIPNEQLEGFHAFVDLLPKETIAKEASAE